MTTLNATMSDFARLSKQKQAEQYATQPFNYFAEVEQAAEDMRQAADKLKTAADRILPCIDCIDLAQIEGEYPNDPHKGKHLVCDTCGAEYHEEWKREERFTLNDQAKKNHPELKTI